MQEPQQALCTHICTLWWCGEGLRHSSGLASKHLSAHCNGVGTQEQQWPYAQASAHCGGVRRERSSGRLYTHTSALCGGVGRDLGAEVALRASIYLHTAMVWGGRQEQQWPYTHAHRPARWCGLTGAAGRGRPAPQHHPGFVAPGVPGPLWRAPGR